MLDNKFSVVVYLVVIFHQSKTQQVPFGNYDDLPDAFYRPSPTSGRSYPNSPQFYSRGIQQTHGNQPPQYYYPSQLRVAIPEQHHQQQQQQHYQSPEQSYPHLNPIHQQQRNGYIGSVYGLGRPEYVQYPQYQPSSSGHQEYPPHDPQGHQQGYSLEDRGYQVYPGRVDINGGRGNFVEYPGRVKQNHFINQHVPSQQQLQYQFQNGFPLNRNAYHNPAAKNIKFDVHAGAGPVTATETIVTNITGTCSSEYNFLMINVHFQQPTFKGIIFTAPSNRNDPRCQVSSDEVDLTSSNTMTLQVALDHSCGTRTFSNQHPDTRSFGNTLVVLENGHPGKQYEVTCSVTGSGVLPYPIVNFQAYPRKETVARPLEARIIGDRGQITVGTDSIRNVLSDCDAETASLRVTLIFGSPFTGTIYTNNYHDVETCTWHFSEAVEGYVQIPLSACGTTYHAQKNRNGAGVFKNTIILMPGGTGAVLTGNDRAYQVSCSMETPDKVKTQDVKAKIDVSPGGYASVQITDSDRLAANVGLGVPISSSEKKVRKGNRVHGKQHRAPLPAVAMKVVQGTDLFAEPADKLVVGSNATVVLYHEQSEFWDLNFGSCYAHDGSGYKKIDILDKRGCPAFDKVGDIISEILGDISYMHFTFESFKFPGREQTYYECHVNVCQGPCKQRDCKSKRNNVDTHAKRALTDEEVAEEEIGYKTEIQEIKRTPPKITPPQQKEDSANEGEIFIESLPLEGPEEIGLFAGVRIDLPGIESEQGTTLAIQQGSHVNECVEMNVFLITVCILAVLLFIAAVIIVLSCYKISRLTKKDHLLPSEPSQLAETLDVKQPTIPRPWYYAMRSAPPRRKAEKHERQAGRTFVPVGESTIGHSHT